MSLRKRLHTLEELVELQDKAIAALKLAIEALERARAEIGSQDKLPFGGIPSGRGQPFKQPNVIPFPEPYQQPYTVPNTGPFTAPSPMWTNKPFQIYGGAGEQNYSNSSLKDWAYKKSALAEAWEQGNVSYGKSN